MALLELRHITRRFGDLEAVKDVTLSVEAGEFFTLLGPSGCGKTTILRMIAGFDEPDDGELFLDDQPLAGIPPEKRPVHTVFQSYALFPHLTVAGNIAFPLEMAGRTREEIRRRVGETLALVHLEEKSAAFPHELSGGQKQRVALARGLVNKPRLLLLDDARFDRICQDLAARLDHLFTSEPVPYRRQNFGDYDIPALTLKPGIEIPGRSGLRLHLAR